MANYNNTNSPLWKNYNDNITSVVIGSGVTHIGDWSFNGYTGLTSISIPASVESIGEYAFTACSNLTSVTFADGSALQSIGEIAFASTNLSSVSIPASVTSIGEYAFSSCSNLATITVAAGNTVYNSPEGSNAIIETTSKKLIVGCKGTTIPNGVEIIGDYAFNECTGLQSITIPASVKTISGGAFSRCTGLTSITIPESVTSIGDYAFDVCSNLTSITLNSNPVISSSALPNNTTVTMNLTANPAGTDYWMTFYNEYYSFTWLMQDVKLLSSTRLSLDLLIRQVEVIRGTLLEATRELRRLSQTERYKHRFDLLMTIPGVGQHVSMCILTEVWDVNRFPNEKAFAHYLGLVPTCHDSGPHKSNGEKTFRGNKHLGPMIIEASWIAIYKDMGWESAMHITSNA